MSTTVHLPKNLLASVDGRAKELGLSRNRYIIRALERMLEAETCWSPGFVQELEAAMTDEPSRQALNEMREAIAQNRNSKAPPAL